MTFIEYVKTRFSKDESEHQVSPELQKWYDQYRKKHDPKALPDTDDGDMWEVGVYEI